MKRSWKNLILVVALLASVLAAGLQPTMARQDPNLFLDVEWYRENLIHSADLWNGGLDGQSGMGAYQEDFSGFFHVGLDREWNQMPLRFSTSIAQSRAIYMNVEAYRAAGPEACQRFLQAATQGADFLLANFYDPEYGGFYWGVQADGTVADDAKQAYGNVHPWFALAHVYSITQNPVYFEAVMEQLDVIQQYFLDPDYPGGILPSFNRDFTQEIGVNNVDAFTHLFETLLALYDITEGEQQEEIADLIVLHGNFLTQHLYHDQDGYTDRGYVAYNYDDQWEPSQIPYSRDMQWSGALHATTGHNIELAYLLSRAVERGFNPEWLDVADKLIKFCLEYAIDPDTGGMIYEITDYEGQPLESNPDNAFYIYWAQAETARALLHYTVVRGRDFGTQFKAVETLFNQYLTDQEYGGLYPTLDGETLEPAGFFIYKGDIWKTNYHYSMFFTEVLRLGEYYPDRIAELNALVTPS